MKKTSRKNAISAEDISAKRAELAALEEAFATQEVDKLVRAARTSAIDLSSFSEAQVAEALRGLPRSFPRTGVAGQSIAAGEVRTAIAGKAKATADG